jgi:hypothetical protein
MREFILNSSDLEEHQKAAELTTGKAGNIKMFKDRAWQI